jgi:hypothetical protein
MRGVCQASVTSFDGAQRPYRCDYPMHATASRKADLPCASFVEVSLTPIRRVPEHGEENISIQLTVADLHAAGTIH